jgi:hypothetical protein
VVAKSPSTASIPAASGFARSRDSIASELSIPATRTPLSESGIAIRPVPIPNSSAAPSPAYAASISTTGPTTSAVDASAERSS